MSRVLITGVGTVVHLAAIPAGAPFAEILEPGRALGYHPVDDAEAYAAGIVADPEPFDAFVGGEFTGPDFDA